MKILRSLLVIATLCMLLTNAHVSLAELKPQFGFTVDIVGTVHFADVEHVKQGISRADGAQDVRVTRASKTFTRLQGWFTGTPEHFARDLNGLIQNRFEVMINERNSGALDVTLTKLEPLTP